MNSPFIDIKLEQDIHKFVRKEWGSTLAYLVKILKDINLAEDSLQDALESALKHWRKNGIPKYPKSWLIKTARHKAIDRLRRLQNFDDKQQQYVDLLELNYSDGLKEDQYYVSDERLRLIFTCCHPTLDKHISVALTLQLLGGLTTNEIARAFLIKKETLAQRLVRGKRKIKQAGIPYIVPDKDTFGQRLSTVLMVLYLIFNEGYSSSSGKNHVRIELCHEAIRLCRILLSLCPNEPEVKALLALMLLHDSRRPARHNEKGDFIPLETQDRCLWLSKQKNEGLKLIESALKQREIGSYQLQASISAVHMEAKDYTSTNWKEIVLIYDEPH